MKKHNPGMPEPTIMQVGTYHLSWDAMENCHRQEDALNFPICESSIEKILCYFRKQDSFASFRTPAPNGYDHFKEIFIASRAFCELADYNLKQIDNYSQKHGEEYFLPTYERKQFAKQL